jgi:hypothetical protein
MEWVKYQFNQQLIRSFYLGYVVGWVNCFYKNKKKYLGIANVFSRRKKINHVEIDPMWPDQLDKSKKKPGQLGKKKHSLFFFFQDTSFLYKKN